MRYSSSEPDAAPDAALDAAADAPVDGVAPVPDAAGERAKLLGPKVVLSRPTLRHPWLAARSGEYGLVWIDASLPKSEVFFSRLNGSGAPSGTIIRVSPL